MRRTKDEADTTRRTLLDAALRVFARDGYATARLEDIAREAGVTRGAIAHHFGGKAEVFAALLDEKVANTRDLARETHLAGGTPAACLRRLMIALLERLADDPDHRAIQELTLFQRGSFPEALRERQAARHRESTYAAGLQRLLERGMERGEFRADLDPTVTIRAILGLLLGVSVNWLIAPDAFSLKDEAADIVDTFLRGLQRQ